MVTKDIFSFVFFVTFVVKNPSTTFDSSATTRKVRNGQ